MKKLYIPNEDYNQKVSSKEKHPGLEHFPSLSTQGPGLGNRQVLGDINNFLLQKWFPMHFNTKGATAFVH